MLSKKDLISLADSMMSWRAFMDEYSYRYALDSLARWCHTQNPRFNESRWRAYIAGECGPSGGTR